MFVELNLRDYSKFYPDEDILDCDGVCNFAYFTTSDLSFVN